MWVLNKQKAKKTAWITKDCSAVQCDCWLINKPHVKLIHGVAHIQQILFKIFSVCLIFYITRTTKQMHSTAVLSVYNS